MARILIRDPAAYRQQRASQEGLKTLKEQHENLHELKTQDKAIVRALRREADVMPLFFPPGMHTIHASTPCSASDWARYRSPSSVTPLCMA
jgi:hypothetical protein